MLGRYCHCAAFLVGKVGSAAVRHFCPWPAVRGGLRCLALHGTLRAAHNNAGALSRLPLASTLAPPCSLDSPALTQRDARSHDSLRAFPRRRSIDSGTRRLRRVVRPGGLDGLPLPRRRELWGRVLGRGHQLRPPIQQPRQQPVVRDKRVAGKPRRTRPSAPIDARAVLAAARTARAAAATTPSVRRPPRPAERRRDARTIAFTPLTDCAAAARRLCMPVPHARVRGVLLGLVDGLLLRLLHRVAPGLRVRQGRRPAALRARLRQRHRVRRSLLLPHLLSHAAQLELTNGGPCARRQCYQPSPSQMCGTGSGPTGGWPSPWPESNYFGTQNTLQALCPTQASQHSFADLMTNRPRITNLLTTVES